MRQKIVEKRIRRLGSVLDAINTDIFLGQASPEEVQVARLLSDARNLLQSRLAAQQKEKQESWQN